jgi:D-sedoheptulose 7-phosphate isomerase
MKHYFLDDLQSLKMVINTSKFSELAENFDKAAHILVKCLKSNNKLLICGNGGSASDAEHMAGEIVGRFGYDRPSLPCISLCTPSATFTAISNDYGYEKVFARQVSGFGNSGDVLIGISTSGNSANIVEAFKTAKELNITTIAMTGSKDSKLSSLADVTLRSGSTKTPRIQEIHSILIHSLCRAVEDEIFNKATSPALPSKKILSQNEIKTLAEAIKGYKSVFTNGCFDILHPGHVYILNECRKQGELLIVGLNSDASIKRLKGESRPYHKFEDRANVLASLEAVDYVIGFDEDTPKELIEALTPNILIKGGDYTPETVVGADWVISHGGKVIIIPLLEGHSTTAILNSNAHK